MKKTKTKSVRNPSCNLCSLYEEAEYPCLIGRGVTPSRIMIIGEAPGYNEDQEGVPFIGKAGQLLNKVLAQHGIHRETCFVTNVVKCRPPNNRTPSRTEIKACSYYLEQEIELVKPRYLLLLGNIALSVVGKSGIMKYRGQEIPYKNGIIAFPTIHPAAVLRNPRNEILFRQDIAYFARLVKGQRVIPDYTVEYVTDVESFKQMCREVYKAKVIAYDYENEGLDPHTGRMWLIGVAVSPTKAWVLPLQHPESPFKEKGLWKKLLNNLFDIMMSKKKLRIVQNGKYEGKWTKVKLKRSDVKYNWDTMLASYILDENTPNGLEYLSQSMLGLKPYKGNITFVDEYDKKGNLIKQVSPLKDMGDYCGEDCCNTLCIALKQIPQVKDDPRLWKLYSRLLLPLSYVLESVELEGIYLDKERLARREKECRRKIEELEAKLNALTPTSYPRPRKEYKRPPRNHDDYYEENGKYYVDLPVNFNSYQQVGEILFSEKGFNCTPVGYTPSGTPSTSEEDLVFLKEEVDENVREFIDTLSEYRRWKNKFLGTYIGPWIEKAIGKGEEKTCPKIYPQFKIHGTVTGRLSSDFQQVPRDNFIRSIITAPPGYKIVEADYSQIELRIAAFIANEPTMLLAYRTGQDLHRLTAASVVGIPPDQVTKEQRQDAKAINFGYIYGMSAEGFRKYAKVEYGKDYTTEEAEEFRKKYFKTYKGLRKWHQRQVGIAQKLGYVRYPNGWKRRLPDIYSHDKYVRSETERQSINSPVQGFAGQITLFSMIRLNKILDPNEVRMFLTVHDSILFYIKEEKLNKWLPVIKRVMEDRKAIRNTFGVDLTIPIDVEIEVGTHWGELEEVAVDEKD